MDIQPRASPHERLTVGLSATPVRIGSDGT